MMLLMTFCILVFYLFTSAVKNSYVYVCVYVCVRARARMHARLNTELLHDW
jgi:hypothetical protein